MHRFHILMIGCKNTSSQFLIRVSQSLVKKFQPVLNRMQELWGKGGGGIKFRGMSPIIPRNVFKHSGKVAKHFEYHQTFWGMLPNIPNQFLGGVPARSALFEKSNAQFSTKNSKP